MSGLLIHSMSEFIPLIQPALECAEIRNIAEIGAEFGGMSQFLAEHCEAAGGMLTSIDPEPKPEFLAWAAVNAHVRHIAAPSLEAMPQLAEVDAWFIDGDHNYFTVRRELAIAAALSRRDGRPLLAFLHDVGWPCARRDQYYAPARIPAEHRRPCSHDAGITLGNAGYLLGRGFRGMGHFAWALEAGGPRNGVLTAVEDFIADELAAGEGAARIEYRHVPAVFGLGVVFDSAAPWAMDLSAQFSPYHDNPLLAALEANRLANYLAVIEWQDRQTAGHAR